MVVCFPHNLVLLDGQIVRFAGFNFDGHVYNKNRGEKMKNETTSLKKFMQTKQLSKITITELVADCDVNRKA